jgi:hypothetical protein
MYRKDVVRIFHYLLDNYCIRKINFELAQISIDIFS